MSLLDFRLRGSDVGLIFLGIGQEASGEVS